MNEERGIVRGRVALLPRSAEIQPWFLRFVVFKTPRVLTQRRSSQQHEARPRLLPLWVGGEGGLSLFRQELSARPSPGARSAPTFSVRICVGICVGISVRLPQRGDQKFCSSRGGEGGLLCSRPELHRSRPPLHSGGRDFFVRIFSEVLGGVGDVLSPSPPSRRPLTSGRRFFCQEFS